MKTKPQIKFLWLIALLLASLACRAATRLITSGTSTLQPSPTFTLSPSSTSARLPSPTATKSVIASCPGLLTDILDRGSTFRVDIGKAPGRNHLVTYAVNGDRISEPHYHFIPADLEDEQKDLVTHESIWNYFAAIIPSEQRTFVKSFLIFTDGPGEELGSVSQYYADMSQWELQIDTLDISNDYELTLTLLHEFGHLLTLNSGQVPPSGVNFMDSEAIYEKEAAACPQYYPPEGCSKPESYINMFYNGFWSGIFEEWQEIDKKQEEGNDELLYGFYRKYADQFLTGYAATSPEEDIAESWAFFVLASTPDPVSIAAEKILFFYEYPALITLRRQIRERICDEFPR